MTSAMRSSLTRLVFRRLIHNEPILHRNCLYRTGTHTWRSGRRAFSCTQRRTLFGFFGQPSQPKANRGEDPGLDVLIDASKNLVTKTRVAEPEVLAQAWRDFFNDRLESSRLINDIQAGHALRVFKHLQKLEQPLLSASDLLLTHAVLTSRRLPKLSKPLKETYSRLVLALAAEIKSLNHEDVHQSAHHDKFTIGMVRFYCFTEQIEKALDCVVVEKEEGAASKYSLFRCLSYIVKACDGRAQRGVLERILTSVENFDFEEQLKIRLRWLVVGTFALSGDLDRAKTLLDLDNLVPSINSVIHFQHDNRVHNNSPPVLLVQQLLTACLKYDDLEMGKKIIRAITDGGVLSILRRMWHPLFVWALGTGRSVDDVDRMAEVMMRTNPKFRPFGETINDLIKFANSKNDPYLAERVLSLGAKWGVPPDAETYLLQMDYRLSVGDIEGARAAYQNLRTQESGDYLDTPRINKLVQAMCGSDKHDFNSIMNVVEELSRGKKDFEPQTVAALSLLHLKRDEYHDVADLLTTHVHQYSSEERAVVRDTFVAVCLDRNNSIARVWDTYMIFQKVFDEADRDVRSCIMNEFFARSRSDMAVHAFNHMRVHTREDTVPTTDTYAMALTGIAKLKDVESLLVVHNSIKLDMNIEPCTKLFNALMLAYIGCDEPRYAQTFWVDICDSSEGPNYNSIMIIFRACECTPFGENRAHSVWNKLTKFDVAMTRDLIAMYAVALAGNQCLKEAKEVVEHCEERFGIAPDTVILGMMFNATRVHSKQAELEEWMNREFPEVYEELIGLGAKENERNGTKLYNVAIPLEP